MNFPCFGDLYDHLRDTLAAQGLAALECLALESSKRVEDGGEHKHHGRGNQARYSGSNAGPLYSAHRKVESGAQVVCLEFADEGVKFG